MYVYGGFETNSGILSDFKVYKNFLNTAEWSELPTENGPGPRHSHSSFFYNNNIYIHGGKVNVLDNTSTIFAFNIESS